MFLAPKHGHNEWWLIIDLRELNRYCSEFSMSCETLKHLHHPSRPGNYFVSLDLTDGYYTLGIREEDRDYFTVNYRGTLWRLACLPMGWSYSAYCFCRLTQVSQSTSAAPLHRPRRQLQQHDALPSVSSATPGGAAPASYLTWTTLCSSPTPTVPHSSYDNASNPCSSNSAFYATPRRAFRRLPKWVTT
jgi:hypothetical protein